VTRDNTIPRCACGCGELAEMVADIHADGCHLQRSPWADLAHAMGAVDDNHPVMIDELAPVAVLLAARTCWCGLRETTVVDWCPRCGYSAALARTQPLPAMTMAELVEDGQ
jgi:hypothetical protein